MNLPISGIPPASTKASHGTPTSAYAPAMFCSRGGTGRNAASAIAGITQRAASGGAAETTVAIVAADAAAHAIVIGLPTALAAATTHDPTKATVSSVGINPIHGRTSMSIGDGRSTVAVTPLLHRSRPFHFVISAHLLYLSTASAAIVCVPASTCIGHGVTRPSRLTVPVTPDAPSKSSVPPVAGVRYPRTYIGVVAPGGMSIACGQLSFGGGRLKNQAGKSSKAW